QFSQGILNPPITWTTGDMSFTYPEQGKSQIKMTFSSGGSGYFFNQQANVNEHITALVSPNIEFIATCSAFWQSYTYFSDIVMPVTYAGERDDMMSWLNYAIYSNTLQAPPGESLSDLEIFRELSAKLGF